MKKTRINKEKFLKALDCAEKWEKNRFNVNLEEAKNMLIEAIREIEVPLRESNDKFFDYLISQNLVFEYLFDEIEELDSEQKVKNKGKTTFQTFFNFYYFSLLEVLETSRERQELEQLISVLEIFQTKKVFPVKDVYWENKESIDKNIETLEKELKNKIKNSQPDLSSAEQNLSIQNSQEESLNLLLTWINDELIIQEKPQEQNPLINNWTNIHPNFTPELIQAWQNHNFTYEQVQDWINIHSPIQQNQAIQEPAFYAYLRDEVKLFPEVVLNDNTINLTELKEYFREWEQLQIQIEIPPKK